MTTKAEILKLVRRKCLDCCGGSSMEVERCTSANCELFDFRFGKDPRPNAAKQRAGLQIHAHKSEGAE